MRRCGGGLSSGRSGGGVQGVAGPPGLLRAQGAADVFLALLAALLSESQWPTDAQHVVGDEDSASVRAPVQDKREVEGETPALAGRSRCWELPQHGRLRCPGNSWSRE